MTGPDGGEQAGVGRIEPIEGTLRSVVVVFRVVGMVWLVVIAGVVLLGDNENLNVPLIVSAMVVAIIWTPVTVVVAFRRPDMLRTRAWLVIDVVLATWTALVPALSHSETFFSGGYPISAALIAAYSFGYPTTVTASAFIAFGSAGALTNDPSPRMLETVTVNLITPTVVAWSFRFLRRNDRLRLEAEEALTVERAERVRSQERADFASHLHDSVLQTLAMVQQNSRDPREVVRLARLQERELRAWLQGAAAFPGAGSMAAALESARAEIESTHGATIELVTVGDCGLDDDTTALVQAGREAMLNAAKFAADGPIYVVAECEDGTSRITVRDRGAGVSLDEVGSDRHGIRDSIVGRVERRGGTAEIRPAPGGGTEVEVTISKQTT